MSHPVETKVARIGRCIRLWTVLYGAAWVVALVVATAFFVGMGDYFLRYQETGLRVIGSLAVATAVVLGFAVFLLPALRYRHSALSVAQRIEQRFPSLRGRLSSTIAFLQQTEQDPTSGSPELRRAVVAQTAAEVDALNLKDSLDHRSSLRMVLVAVIVCEIVAGICVFDPSSAALAAQRMIAPWSAVAWPKRNDLRFVDPPDRLAAGSDFSIEVMDANSALPEGVEFQYQFDGSQRVQTKRMKFLNDKMVLQLDNVTDSLEYRAVGGDDETAWRTLQVLEPPRIESLEVTLHPPAHTGWPTETSDGHIRALQNTRIEIVGKSTAALQKSVLKFQHDDGVESRDMRLLDDSLGFAVPATRDDPWVVTRSGTYWLELLDRERKVTGVSERWEIRAIEDRPPTVVLDQPSNNRFVTSDAAVSISATIIDDLAIDAIEFHYTHFSRNARGSEQARPPQTLELYRRSNSESASGGTRDEQLEDSRTVSYTLDLSTLPELRPGDHLDLHVSASDCSPQSGRSAVRRLSVITAEELAERIGQRQTTILAQLQEALRAQKDARSQVKSLEIEAAETATLEKQDVDQLQSAELNQRQVRRLLSEDDHSVERLIVALLTDLETNQVDNPDVRRRMTDVLNVVRQIDRQHLTTVQRELISALKIGRATNSDVDGSVAEPLTAAGREQGVVILMLTNLLEELGQWDNYRRFSRDIVRLRREQQQLGEQIFELRKQTLTKSFSSLSPQERAGLKKAAQRQLELALTFDKILGGMQRMQTQLAQSEPLAAETLADAIQAARELAIGGQMRQAARDVERNRIGQATETQDEVLLGLDRLLDILSNRREHELARLVEQLREATDELASLSQQHEALREKIESASQNSDPQQQREQLEGLSEQQQQLADQIEDLARELERLRAQRASDTSQQAAETLRKSAAAAGQGDGPQAADQADEVQRLIKQAQQELEDYAAEAEQELFREQLVRLEQQISGLLARQQGVINRTVVFDDLRDADGELGRAQRSAVLELAQEQLAVAEETEALAKRVGGAGAFDLGFRSAAREMFRAAARLTRLDTGEETQLAEAVAKLRLKQLLDAVKPATNGEPAPEDMQDPGDAKPLPGDLVRILAELKLLKLMQEEVLRRTSDLEDERLRRGGVLTEEQEQELADLAKEQGELAELMLQLSQPAEANPEDDPDSLPDLRENKLDSDESLEEDLLEGLEDE